MFILILLLCATAAAESSNIPKIDGLEKSGFFNYRLQEFENRRLFVNIVDTVHSASASSGNVLHATVTDEAVGPFDDQAPKAILPTTIAIGLLPSEKHPEYYDFVSRRIAESLRCMDASDAEFEQDAGVPEYVLTIDQSNTLNITRDEENSGDSDALLRRVAVQAGMTEDETKKIELADCWYMRSPEVMRINVVAGAEPMIRSGWIVERYPLGKFYKNREPNYRYPVYLTNYSYIDSTSGAIVDVVESKDQRGKSIWTPTGWPAFARTRMEEVPVKTVGESSNYTMFRETATGVLVATLAQTMHLSYNIDEDSFEERIILDGHHYHVTCDRKPIAPIIQVDERMIGTFPFEDLPITVEIRLSSSEGSSSFSCSPKRVTETGVPEVLQLDYVEHTGGRSIPSSHREVTVSRTPKKLHREFRNGAPIPSSDREVTVSRMLNNGQRVSSMPTRSYPRRTRPTTPSRYEATTTEPNVNLENWFDFEDDDLPPHLRVPVSDKADIDQAQEDSLSSLALMIILALTAVICVGACAREYIRRSRNPMVKVCVSDKNGEKMTRKDGYADTAETGRQPMEAIDNKSEEEEEPKPSSLPTPLPRSNSGKKKTISFAPRKSILTMIDETELGTRIDAMVEAGPDREEEEEMQPVQQGEAAATGATAEVVDETSEAPKTEKTEKPE